MESKVDIAHEALASLVAHSAMQVEHIRGLGEGRILESLRPQDKGADSVGITLNDDGSINIRIDVAVAYGTRLPEVAESLSRQVKQDVYGQTRTNVRDVVMNVVVVHQD